MFTSADASERTGCPPPAAHSPSQRIRRLLQNPLCKPFMPNESRIHGTGYFAPAPLILLEPKVCHRIRGIEVNLSVACQNKAPSNPAVHCYR